MRKTSNISLDNGFTLIELMIVVFIIAILAMIAVPSYQHHIRKSRRQEGVSELLHLQALQAKYRATNTTYGTLEQIGGSSSSTYYNYTVTGNTTTAYTLTATAKEGTSQATDTENSTACTPLSLNQDNTKLPSGCWTN